MQIGNMDIGLFLVVVVVFFGHLGSWTLLGLAPQCQDASSPISPKPKFTVGLFATWSAHN